MRQKIQRTLVLGALVAVMEAAGQVSAKNGFYLGAGLGKASLKIDDLELDLDAFDYKDDATSYKIIAGYRFMGFLAVEGSYVDFGSFKDGTQGDGESVSLETKLKGFDAFAMGMLPLGLADLFVKVGVVSWDADITRAIGEITDFEALHPGGGRVPRGPAQYGLDARQQHVRVDRLHDHVVGALGEGGHGRVMMRGTADDDDGQVLVAPVAVDHAHDIAAAVTHAHVQQDHVGERPLEQVDRLLPVRREDHLQRPLGKSRVAIQTDRGGSQRRTLCKPASPGIFRILSVFS